MAPKKDYYELLGVSRTATADELTRQLIELKNTDSRIAMLSAMEKEYEGFAGAVKTVMREARHGALRGVHGTVAELTAGGEWTWSALSAPGDYSEAGGVVTITTTNTVRRMIRIGVIAAP